MIKDIVKADIGFGVKLEMSMSPLSGLLDNLTALGEYLSKKTVMTVQGIAQDILAAAQPTVPVDTGLLRESGQAVLYVGGSAGEVVAKGNSDGTTDNYNYNYTGGAVKSVDADVSYNRFSNDGFDVAVFTHEHLVPEPGAKAHARTAGTGPKYLENAFWRNETEFTNRLKDILNLKTFESTTTPYITKVDVRANVTQELKITLDFKTKIKNAKAELSSPKATRQGLYTATRGMSGITVASQLTTEKQKAAYYKTRYGIEYKDKSRKRKK
jgi:hypothetical protein